MNNEKKEVNFIVLYFIIGFLGILLSDKFFIWAFEDLYYINQIQTYKGWIFVTISGLLFYYIIHQSMKELRNKKRDIIVHREKLNEMNKELKKFNKESIEVQKEIIFLLTKILEFHGQYTTGHSNNVANIAKKIAIKMKLDNKKVQQVYWASILHDIGKILIPDNVLNKKDKLTEVEFALIKSHPYLGYITLLQSKRLKELADYVYYHHERWDGKGYPKGLKEDEIPLIAQIISLADSWDAMTSIRSYKKALTKKEAINEIKKYRGKQFSPKVVDIFLNEINLKSQ